MRVGGRVPDSIQNAPTLNWGLGMFLVGFLDLTGSRNSGMSTGSIPWAVIQDYCKTTGLDEDQTDDMHYYIGALDVAWQKHHKKDTPSSG